MNSMNRISRSRWLSISMLSSITACTALILYLVFSSTDASARTADDFGPACGSAVMDGIIHPDEWSGAAIQIFQMVSPGAQDPFTATLYVKNNGTDLYMGITINDDEFSIKGTWLPQGDGFRIDFDNDNSGSLFAIHDDVLDIVAGAPQFSDNYIYAANSAQSDKMGGGKEEGSGAASRVGTLNHFELKHRLCSGDALDFCLHSGDRVGFRLEYLDAQADGSFGGSQYFPGQLVTSIASIVIGQCSVSGESQYLPLILK